MDDALRSVCAACGERLEQGETGRPRKYCSDVCRRSAKFDLRRAQALLKRAEQRAQDAALQVHMADQWQQAIGEKRLSFWKGEVDRLREVLRSCWLAPRLRERRQVLMSVLARLLMDPNARVAPARGWRHMVGPNPITTTSRGSLHRV